MSVPADAVPGVRGERSTAKILRLPTSTVTTATGTTYRGESGTAAELSVSREQIEQLSQEIQAIRDLLVAQVTQERAEGDRHTLSSATFSWGTSYPTAPLGHYYLTLTAYGAPGADNRSNQARPLPRTREATVPLSVALTIGSILWGVVSLGSLAMWIAHDVSVLSPFVAILGVVGAPFLYSMGVAASRR